jgi:foldase protein PrsA
VPVVLVGALLFAGCGSLFDTAAAVVAGRKISVDVLNEGLEEYKKSLPYKRLSAQGDPRDLQRSYEQTLLTELIRREILGVEAEKRDISVADDEVQERMDEIKAQYENESAYEEDLKENGLTLEHLEQLVGDQILEEKLREEVTADITLDEAEARAFYDENTDAFTQTRSQHILVESRGLAGTIAAELQDLPQNQVEAAFERLARQHSTDQSNANSGGDLGFRRPGELVEEYETAANDLEVGEVSDPVQTEFGFHVIRVIDRRLTPFEEAVPQIEETLLEQDAEQAWDEFIRNAYEEADVRVNSRYGELDLESQTVVDATAEDIPGGEFTPTPSPTG